MNKNQYIKKCRKLIPHRNEGDLFRILSSKRKNVIRFIQFSWYELGRYELHHIINISFSYRNTSSKLRIYKLKLIVSIYPNPIYKKEIEISFNLHILLIISVLQLLNDKTLVFLLRMILIAALQYKQKEK